MINPIVRRSHLGSLLLCAALGCTGDRLDQPGSPVPAMMMQVRFPEIQPAGNVEIGLQLATIPYCPISAWPHQPVQPNDLPIVYPPLQPFDPSVETMEVPAWGGGDLRGFSCPAQDAPLIRFFQPTVSVLPSSTGWIEMPWTTRDTIVAYTDEPVTFTPFGPTDEPIALGRGYSLLRRTCGTSDAPWRLQVVASDAPVDFHPPRFSGVPQPLPPLATLLEQSERDLLEGCRIERPPVSLMKRVSFDHAASLAFSGNGAELLYLLPVDPTDAAQGAPLRSVTVADGSVRQLTVVPQGRDLQVTNAGVVYVATGVNAGNLGRVWPEPDGSATIDLLPVSGQGRVSPDGKWIVYPRISGATFVDSRLWDVVAGTRHSVVFPSVVLGWSPGSLLVATEPGTGQPGSVYDLFDPFDGHMTEQVVAASSGSMSRLLWGAGGPIEMTAPTFWRPQQPASASHLTWVPSEDEKVFGLVIEDLRGGSVVSVLDADAGRITYAASVPGTALFWARKCMGLFETVCSFDLHRVILPEGGDQVVAVADSAATVALSASGDRLGIAARDGIYVRDLP